MSVAEVSQHATHSRYFVVLDERTVQDNTALLVTRGDNLDYGTPTVRVTFDTAQHLLISLEIGNMGFKELQDIAASQDGALGSHPEPPKKGDPAPRKKLGS
jgi:hypothetical protein